MAGHAEGIHPCGMGAATHGVGRWGDPAQALRPLPVKRVIVAPKLCDFRRAVWNNENMANLEKKGYVDPGWPKQTPGGGHYVTEVIAKFAGANSPYGDVEFPVPAEELGYVHPYTRINK